MRRPQLMYRIFWMAQTKKKQMIERWIGREILFKNYIRVRHSSSFGSLLSPTEQLIRPAEARWSHTFASMMYHRKSYTYSRPSWSIIRGGVEVASPVSMSACLNIVGLIYAVTNSLQPEGDTKSSSMSGCTCLDFHWKERTTSSSDIRAMQSYDI